MGTLSESVPFGPSQSGRSAANVYLRARTAVGYAACDEREKDEAGGSPGTDSSVLRVTLHEKHVSVCQLPISQPGTGLSPVLAWLSGCRFGRRGNDGQGHFDARM